MGMDGCCWSLFLDMIQTKQGFRCNKLISLNDSSEYPPFLELLGGAFKGAPSIVLPRNFNIHNNSETLGGMIGKNSQLI